MSGNIDEKIEKKIIENEDIQKLVSREADYVQPTTTNKEILNKENIVTESMEVTQGKLVLGLDVDIDKEDLKYDTLIYNSLLGGTATSKMFQNVREKAHLAYVASSSYLRNKNNIFINCGIDIPNYEKALELIKEQIEDMKKGDFTEEEIQNAKKGIIATIKTIEDEQDTEVSYYFGKSFGNRKIENAADLAMFLLEEGHVATVGGAAFGTPECLRFSYATSDENLVEALRRIKEALAKMK